jgi:hypothetical protein
MKKLLFLAVAAILVALSFSGCKTQKAAPAGDVGFPLIDIVDATVDLALDSSFAQDEEKWTRSANTRIVGGTLGTKIVPKDITINLIETSFQVPIRNGEDVSTWFLNKPKGLTFTAHALDPKAKFAAEKGDTRIIVTIEGTPTQTINQPIKIGVPYAVLNRLWDFHIPPSEDRRFEVYGVEITAVVVGGAVNRDIDPKTFKIVIGGTKLADTLAMDTDISSWFTNIPRGLNAVVTEDAMPVSDEEPETVSDDKSGEKKEKQQQTVTITMSGRPTIQVNERMKVVIPASVTVANIDLEIPPSDKAKYDIGSYSSISANDVELRTGSNWRGVVQGWGLTGPEVYKAKDFTAVGIIQITTESVYAIGVDGEYHWTGDSISYGDLMAEARRMDAHAIIDVVIDSKDTINETTEKRHIEAGHPPTDLEKIKIAKGLIQQEKDTNGGDIYIEKISVTRRVWTGTALAIRYAPAYEPRVGEGTTSGYYPAYPK